MVSMVDGPSFLLLESALWEISNSKRHIKYLNDRKKFSKKIKIAAHILKVERGTLLKKRSSTESKRSRKTFLQQQNTKIDDCLTFLSRLLGCFNEADLRLVNYHSKKTQFLASESYHNQPREKMINSQLQKVRLRVQGYTRHAKILVDALHERRKTHDGDTIGEYIWQRNQDMMNAVGGRSEIPPKVPHIISNFNTVMVSLQLVEIYCSRLPSIPTDWTLEYYDYVCHCGEVTGTCILLIRGWEDRQESTSLLSQSLKALHAVLATGLMIPNKGISGLRLFPWGQASLRRLIEEIIGLNVLSLQIRNNTEKDIACDWRGLLSQAMRNLVFIPGDVTFHALSCSRYLLLLLCKEVQIPTAAPAPGPTGSGAQDEDSSFLLRLLDSAFALGHHSIVKHSIVFNSDLIRTIGDAMLLEAMLSEITVTIDLLTAAYSSGLVTTEMTAILTDTQELIITAQIENLPLIAAWLQAILSACLYATANTTTAVSSKKLSMSTLSPLLASLMEYLNGASLVVLEVLQLHKAVSSVQHKALLVLRILLRPPFMSVRDVDSFLSDFESESITAEPVSSYITPTTRQSTTTKDQHSAAEDTVSVMTQNTYDTAYTETTALSQSSASLVAEDKLPPKLPVKGVLLLSLLGGIIVTHVQVDEVIEQWLLLVIHLSNFSYLAKLALHEAGVFASLERLIGLRRNTATAYTLALMELCLEVMEEKSY